MHYCVCGDPDLFRGEDYTVRIANIKDLGGEFWLHAREVETCRNCGRVTVQGRPIAHKLLKVLLDIVERYEQKVAQVLTVLIQVERIPYSKIKEASGFDFMGKDWPAIDRNHPEDAYARMNLPYLRLLFLWADKPYTRPEDWVRR